MYEGKIIKFYREKSQLTQEQLGRGICSDTHISKIERGSTEYSPEIITFLSKRMQIDISLEAIRLKNIRTRLHHWHDVIIEQLFEEMAVLYKELEQEPLIQLSDYQPLYNLLKARYYLMHNQADKAYKVIKIFHKDVQQLPLYESNLYKHVMGMYYMSKQEYLKAIDTLTAIVHEDYNNPEYYYHLASAYHAIQSPVMAYFYAEKSLAFFKGINSFLRIIDAEMLMLIQVKDEKSRDFKETIRRFEKLIQSCDICQAPVRKARVLHNLAYEYMRRENYKLASKYYQQSMNLKEKKTGGYLLSLEGYIRSCLHGNLLPSEELIQIAKDGLALAKKLKEIFYMHLLQLLLLSIQNREHEYHVYLSDIALPKFRESGNTYLIQNSEKELFAFYMKTNQPDKALDIATKVMNKVN
ncbi:helix-turn-helix domain-containing protein [Paenibacillus sp. LjRoot56]|uniref:helix-turn-helix domain-containing protein n=1 Tax=Paenibacillus sp. LjRoot56 TaxID=3342333 RepID=UPI003ECE873E